MINPEQLPADPAEIDEPNIASARTAFGVAKQTADQASKTLTQLTDYDLDAAKEQDVALAVAARREGNPDPKRTNTAKVEKAVTDAEFEVGVTAGQLKEAREALQAALREHGDEYRQIVAQQREAAHAARNAALDQLQSAIADETRARELERRLGSQLLSIRVVKIPTRDLGLQGSLDRDAVRLVGELSTFDIIERLRTLGVEPQPEDQPDPALLQRRRLARIDTSELTPEQRDAKRLETAAMGRRWLQPDPGIENEQRERERFAEKAASRSNASTTTQEDD